MKSMLGDLQATAGDTCSVHAYTDLVGFIKIWTETVEQVSGLGSRVGGHADIAEASEILVVRPDLFREDRAEQGRLGELDAELVDRIFSEGFREITPNGVLGDTRGASERIGLATLARAADVIVDQFRGNSDA